MIPLHRVSPFAAVTLLTAGVTATAGLGVLWQSGRIIDADAAPWPMDGERSFTIMRPPAPTAHQDWSQLIDYKAVAGIDADLARRYRLAGTYLEVGVGPAEEPRAIIDDLQAGEQRLVRRGDELAPGVKVKQVARYSVTLECGGRETILRQLLDGASPRETPPPGGTTDGAGDALARFGGAQPFRNRWRFDRQRLLEYYDELRDEPERLLAIFDSFDPYYDAQQKIAGYAVGIEGEADFFAAAGLKNGDVIRAVNSVPMTSRRRAEHFIRRFVDEQAEAFVLEVERDGKTEKQVYVIPKPGGME